MNGWQRAAALAALCSTLILASGCVPLVIGAGVAGGALVATDRRSAGAQVDDEAIELKIANQIVNRWGDRAHVSTTSYNGIVLLTGEVPDAQAKAALVGIARGTERVRAVHDETVVGPVSSLSDRSRDTLITAKVKTRFVDTKPRFSATHVKVVTDRGVVYLMGIVSRDEGNAAGEIAATTTDVARVVKLFEYTG